MQLDYDVKIRKLTRKDRVTMTKLIQKLANIKQSTQLVSMVPNFNKSDSEEESNESNALSEILEFAFTLLQEMIKFIEDDVTKWFIDLSGLTPEEYDDNFDIEMQIAHQLIEQKKFKDFFLRGSLVLKTIKDLASRFKK